MPLSGSLIERLSEQLSRRLERPVDIERHVPVGGGSINDAYRLDTDSGRYFVKVNSADRFPSLFASEADGLMRLAATGTLRTPDVFALGEDHDDSYLLLEHIDAGPKDRGSWERLGRGLAALHRHQGSSFGLDRPNHIGTLTQVNTPAATWPEFLVQARLEPMLKLARDKRRVEGGLVQRFERLFNRLGELFPEEPPALLHGDLWSGNVLCDTSGGPVLIDPAVYYGHREMDVAMTRLFGGFDPAFLGAYMDERPMEPGWEERMDLCNLYPLLVHLILFGEGYAAQVRTALGRYA
ncbi:MAG: fructosamine kinase family protein [Flavobacteriales bacterium]|nr:fructosamine kinase family protein [Flavobacteriales bacterium]